MDIKEILERLKTYSTPELSDGAVDYKTMDYRIKPMVGKKIVGLAKTIDVPYGEGGRITELIDEVGENEVIVIAGKGCTEKSYWGDHRSLCAKLKGAVGVVIDGVFRDVDGCEEIGFPIFAMGITPGTAGKAKVGELNGKVTCGGIEVRPGDIIVGDRNGIIVIPPEKSGDIMAKADIKREAQEYTLDEMKRTGNIYPRVIFPNK